MNPLSSHKTNDEKHLGIPIKVCLVGDTGTGKSSIIYRIDHTDLIGSEKHSTIGASFKSLKMRINNKLINFHMWDTAGQERFNSLVPLYFRGTDIFMIVFDLNNPKSWENIEKVWMPMIQKYLYQESAIVLLVGNKMELEHLVTNKDVEQFCTKNDLECIKISAKTQQTNEIVSECLIKSFDICAVKNPSIFEKMDNKNITLHKKENKTVKTPKTSKMCSNKVECAN